MPSKIRPGDWDYYFSPNNPRRGGPLRAVANILIFGVILLLVGVGGRYAYATYTVRQERMRETAIAQSTANTLAMTTRTALTLATREARTAVALNLTATAGAATPTVDGASLGKVIAGGNLRSEPRVANETVLGLIWPGDEVAFLEQQSTPSGVWYRIRVVREGQNRGGAGVAAGTEGWASGTLLSAPGQ